MWLLETVFCIFWQILEVILTIFLFVYIIFFNNFLFRRKLVLFMILRINLIIIQFKFFGYRYHYINHERYNISGEIFREKTNCLVKNRVQVFYFRPRAQISYFRPCGTADYITHFRHVNLFHITFFSFLQVNIFRSTTLNQAFT